MRKLLVVLFVLTLTLMAVPAMADTFDFTFTNASGDAVLSGQLGGDPIGKDALGNDVFAITYGSATFSDTAWNGGNGTYSVALNPNSPNPANSTVPVGYFTYDDLLTPWAPAGGALDGYGLLVLNGPDTLAIYIGGTGIGNPYYWQLADSGGYRVGGNDGSLVVTPEPASLLMFGSGILGFLGVARRKFLGKLS